MSPPATDDVTEGHTELQHALAAGAVPLALFLAGRHDDAVCALLCSVRAAAGAPPRERAFTVAAGAAVLAALLSSPSAPVFDRACLLRGVGALVLFEGPWRLCSGGARAAALGMGWGERAATLEAALAAVAAWLLGGSGGSGVCGDIVRVVLGGSAAAGLLTLPACVLLSPVRASIGWVGSIILYGLLAAICTLQYVTLSSLLPTSPLTFLWGLIFQQQQQQQYTAHLILSWLLILSCLIFIPSPPPPDDVSAKSRSSLLQCVSRRHTLLLLRKVYHLAAVAMFLPALVLHVWGGGGMSPDAGGFLGVSLAMAVQVLTGAEVLRALRAQPLAVSSRIHTFMSRHTDARDNGTYLRSHLHLLLGCATPVWGARTVAGGAADTMIPFLTLIHASVGVLALGVGDAAAAAAGLSASAAGTHVSWGALLHPLLSPISTTLAPPRGGKSVQGSLAFVVAVMASGALLCVTLCALMGGSRLLLQVLLHNGGGVDIRRLGLSLLCSAVIGSGAEAAAGGLDNLIVPGWAWFGAVACGSLG